MTGNATNAVDPTGEFGITNILVTAGISGVIAAGFTGAYGYAKGWSSGEIAKASAYSFLLGAGFGALGAGAFAGAGAVGVAGAGSATVGHVALGIILSGVSMPLAINNFIIAQREGDSVDKVFAAVDLALAGGDFFLVRVAASRPTWLGPATPGVLATPKPQVEVVGNGVIEFLGPRFAINRDTPRAFVAISADKRRMFRIDFEEHGYPPHAHL